MAEHAGQAGAGPFSREGVAGAVAGNPNEALVAEVTGLPSGEALDVGSGEGADALWLARHGWHVSAVDVSETALRRGAAAAAADAAADAADAMADAAGAEARTGAAARGPGTEAASLLPRTPPLPPPLVVRWAPRHRDHRGNPCGCG